MSDQTFYEAAWELVRHVPPGKVVTYGQVATWLHRPRAARAVGYAMFRLDLLSSSNSHAAAEVPWHRVINAKGEISIGGHLHRPDLQRRLLEDEGIEFDDNGRIDLRRYRWNGRGQLRRTRLRR